jgi:hypothetical protein
VAALHRNLRAERDAVDKMIDKDGKRGVSGPMVAILIERHRKRTGCSGNLFEYKDDTHSEWICQWCQKGIATTGGGA